MFRTTILAILLGFPLFTFGQQLELLTPLNESIQESSGLIFIEDRLITHNDSGGESELYEVDTLTGEIVRIVYVENANNKDWEDICHDETYIYIGDFGNNLNIRTDLKIYRISKEDYLNLDTVAADFITFNYQDQTDFTPANMNAEYDAEAMISLGDSLYIFTKNWADNNTSVYPIPKSTFQNDTGVHELIKLDTWEAQGLITGADICTTTGNILLSGYTTMHPFVVSISNYEHNAFFQGQVERITLQAPSGYSHQIEGVAAISPDLFYISAEKLAISNLPTLHAGLYKLDFNTTTITEIENNFPPIYPNPTADYFHISSSEQTTIFIYNVLGQITHTDTSPKIDIRNFPIDSYIIKIYDNKHQLLSTQKLIIQR